MSFKTSEDPVINASENESNMPAKQPTESPAADPTEAVSHSATATLSKDDPKPDTAGKGDTDTASPISQLEQQKQAAQQAQQGAEDVVMHAQALRKAYHIYPTPLSRLKQMVWGDRRQYFKEFVALDGLDFRLKRGEVLGVVGRNGAGKSTLLQLICGTLTPSSGSLNVKGRIAALLELGAGFNPEFTGRENVYFSAAVMGLERSEVDALLEGIIDFSGIRPFIDQPVKTYSSGMYVRLAFAVATSVDPDILVIDEALSVGDGDFARRSFERIMTMRDAGKTILFCSHSLFQVETLCSRAIWLEGGKVVDMGPPDTVIPKYQNFLDSLSIDESNAAARTAEQNAADNASANRQHEVAEAAPTMATQTRLSTVSVAADGIKGTDFIVHSDHSDLQLEVNFLSHIADETPGVAVVIHAASGHLVSSCASWNEDFYPEIDPYGRGRIRINFDKLPLLKGSYNVGVLLMCGRGIMLYDEMDPVATLEVKQQGIARGFVNLPHQWSPEKIETTDSDRWFASDARSSQEAELLALFERSFGHPMSVEEWRWKYKLSLSPGTIVHEGDTPVAFNGGMPRKALINGVEKTVVHIGDSMVSPESRGVLTRKGPFYLSVHHYYENHIGPQQQFSLSFGFPHIRHAKLGIKRGLYCQMDTIVQARWPGTLIADPQLSTRPYREKDSDQIDILWQQMQRDCPQGVICQRDSSWMTHRYCDKPNNNYQLHLVCHQQQQNCIGLIVLKDHGSDGVELLDIVAPREHSEAIIAAAMGLTHQLTRDWLFAWFTPHALSWFAQTQPIEEPTSVIIAGSAVNDIDYSLSTAEQWWLMGGDTDSR